MCILFYIYTLEKTVIQLYSYTYKLIPTISVLFMMGKSIKTVSKQFQYTCTVHLT